MSRALDTLLAYPIPALMRLVNVLEMQMPPRNMASLASQWHDDMLLRIWLCCLGGDATFVMIFFVLYRLHAVFGDLIQNY